MSIARLFKRNKTNIKLKKITKMTGLSLFASAGIAEMNLDELPDAIV